MYRYADTQIGARLRLLTRAQVRGRCQTRATARTRTRVGGSGGSRALLRLTRARSGRAGPLLFT